MRLKFTAQRVLTLLLSFALLFGLAGSVVLPGPGYAYTPADIPMNAGVEPQVKAQITHTKIPVVGKEDRDPHPGETFKYNAEWKFSQLSEQGVNHSITLNIHTDPYAPFTATPTAANFTVPQGWKINSVTCDKGSCNVKVYAPAGAQTGTIKFTGTAKVKSADELGADGNKKLEGRLISASVNAEIIAEPTLDPKKVEETFKPNGSLCAGWWTFKINMAKAGGWLADIKFADALGEGKIKLNKDPLSATNPNSKITVKDASGKDITAEVLAGMKYNSQDSQPPAFPNDVTQRYPNAKWLQSANWEVDMSTFTGKTWLPAGAEVTITKYGEHEHCIDPGFAADWQAKRPLGIAISVVRPKFSTGDYALDEFTLPGEPQRKVLSCQEDIFFVTGGADKQPSDIGRVIKPHSDPAGQFGYEILRKAAPGGVYKATGVAISDKYPSRVYFTPKGRNGVLELWYWDMSKSAGDKDEFVKVNASPMPSSSSNTIGSGFDQHGNMWMVVTKNNSSIAELQKVDVFSPKPTVVTVGTLPETQENKTARDIIFDSKDNAYIVLTKSNLFGQSIGGSLIKIPAEQLQKGGKLQPTQLGNTIDSGSGWQGIAWGADGLIYLAKIGKMFAIDPATGKVKREFSPKDNGQSTDLVDMASCNYGEPVEDGPSPAKFRIKKSAINPETGAIEEPGTASKGKVTINPDGTAHVDYLVTVQNIGQTTGTPKQILDRPVVPEGFVITKATVDGKEVPTTGWELKPGELAGNEFVTFQIGLDLKAEDLTKVNWSQAGDCGCMEGKYEGGFYNAVTMDEDSDGPENNHGCIPAKPRYPAYLTLIKDITDIEGKKVPANSPEAADAQHFTLGAFGSNGGQVSGTSPSSGQPAVNEVKVIAGSFTLYENGNDQVNDYIYGTQWSCQNRAGVTVPVSETNTVKVAPNDHVVCRIANNPAPKVKIVKTATNPTKDNAHIGQPVNIDGAEPFTVKYTITVTNHGKYITNTGAVVDQFQVPDGLKWAKEGAQEKLAKVTFDPGDTGATGLRNNKTFGAGSFSLTRAELADLATLARSIRSLPAGASVKFTLEIPLQADTKETTTAQGEKITVFDQNRDRLAECSNLVDGKYPHTDSKKGVPNTASLDGEDTKYATYWKTDNVACVPITKEEPELPGLPLTGGMSRIAFLIGGMLVVSVGVVAAVVYRRIRRQ